MRSNVARALTVALAVAGGAQSDGPPEGDRRRCQLGPASEPRYDAIPAMPNIRVGPAEPRAGRCAHPAVDRQSEGASPGDPMTPRPRARSRRLRAAGHADSRAFRSRSARSARTGDADPRRARSDPDPGAGPGSDDPCDPRPDADADSRAGAGSNACSPGRGTDRGPDPGRAGPDARRRRPRA